MAISNSVSVHQETTGISRRDFFRVSGVVAGGAMLLGLPRFSGRWLNQAEAAQAGSPMGGLRVILVLDNVATNITSVSGGNQFADVALEPVGPDLIQRKRPGTLKVEDLVVELALDAPSPALNGWITDTLTKGPTFKNGSIVYADYDGNIGKQLDFSNAAITEIDLPAGDASSKDLVTLKFRITPQSTRLGGGTGKISFPLVKSPSSRLIQANFRLSVQGLEAATPGITRVEPIVVRRLIQAQSVGATREPMRSPSVLDCSLLSILIVEQKAGLFYSWFDDFVLKGNNGAGKERQGLLEWMSPNTQKPAASIQLSNLGIVRYAPEPVQAGVDSIQRVRVDMYCESATMKL